MADSELVTLAELSERIMELEKECRHFHRQFELLISHIERSDGMAQNSEYRLRKLEKNSIMRRVLK